MSKPLWSPGPPGQGAVPPPCAPSAPASLCKHQPEGLLFPEIQRHRHFPLGLYLSVTFPVRLSCFFHLLSEP